jgi:AraC-like DNA-binding protein
MSATHASLTETHIVGHATRQWIVRAEDCPALLAHHIKHVAITEAAAPFRVVRLDPDGSFMLACFAGRGRILLDGRWQTCRAGVVGLAPPHVLDAFHAVPGVRWGICWVRYREPRGRQPMVTAASPVLARFDLEPLRSAIWGLYHEVNGAADPAAVRHWVELVQGYAARFAKPLHVDERLWRIWERVAPDLGEAWTLEKLARLANMSGEHLRRLCRHQLGRSPMQQVTFLRIQRAAELLESTDDKVETIARAIGYENPFVFSTKFKKWTGWRPTDYRQRRLR